MFGGGCACARSQQCARGHPPVPLPGLLSQASRASIDGFANLANFSAHIPILVKSMPGRACSSATVWEVNRRALAMAPPAPSPTPRPPAFLSGALNDAATRARLARLDHDREVRADRNVFRAQLLCQLDIRIGAYAGCPGRARASRPRGSPVPITRPPPETADAADAAGIAQVARARVERAARDADRAFRRDTYATLDRLERDALRAELHARETFARSPPARAAATALATPPLIPRHPHAA